MFLRERPQLLHDWIRLVTAEAKLKFLACLLARLRFLGAHAPILSGKRKRVKGTATRGCDQKWWARFGERTRLVPTCRERPADGIDGQW